MSLPKFLNVHLYICLMLCMCFVVNCNGEKTDVLDALLVRIEQLELNDAANKLRISELEVREDKLVSEVNELKTKNDLLSRDCTKQVDDEDSEDMNEDLHEGLTATKTSMHKQRHQRIVREAPEMEVGFYATHTQHDILHLGANQALTFDDIVTNIGNAFNKFSGIFVSPVDGTYVFHATVMGRDVHNATHSRYSAHLDIDNVTYAQLYTHPYDQSSQMLVINLKAGQSVSVRNSHTDEGYIGQHFSTFSGFLLYEHFNSGGTIVGK